MALSCRADRRQPRQLSSGNPGCTATDCNFNVHSSGLQADVLRAKINYKF